MSYDLSNDAEPAGPGPLPGIFDPTDANLRRWGRGILAISGTVFLVLLLWWLRAAYTDLLWFDHLGYSAVFVKILVLKLWLFAAGAIVAGIVLLGNLYLAYRHSRGESILNQPPVVVRVLTASAILSAALVVLIGVPVFGGEASDRWETLLVFFNRVPFGIPDPQFSRDATFYITTLRVMHFAQGWFMGLAITAAAATLSMYLAIHAIRGTSLVSLPMLKHSAALGVFLMATIAAEHALNYFELALSQNGIVAGATYTDVHARVLAQWLMTGVALLAAAGFAASNYFGGLKLMLGSFGLWVLVALLAGLIYPALYQRFQVDPNELARERPYIERNIEATRFAYGLDRVGVAQFPAHGRLDSQVIRDNRATVDNIRLWDGQPLLDVFNQLQFIELYYRFLNTDSDRYRVDGRLRQVLIAARELDTDRLPPDAQNWVNRTLQYTHGYGVSMSPANTIIPGEGRPDYFIHDIPIEGDFPVTRPEVYYGESAVPFVVVGHRLDEVDPESGSLRYQGSGGVPLSSLFRRSAYAWQMGDVNLLLSDQITEDSRIQYRRGIRKRVGTIAPFLELDRDPYPVVDESGKLWWIQDAYTTTDRYPYSANLDGRFNYIRNSVKVVVDAYNGAVDFYAVDPGDPLLRMYSNAFPGLLRDFDEMPGGLRDHVRYPIGLFSAQASVYLRYHVTDPHVFFNQAEQWAFPLETRFGKSGVRVTPSYMVLKNPGEDKEEFVLMVPFTPAGEKHNLASWLMARNDWPHYGELISYRVPTNTQVDGPSQVEARIQNDQIISQQFSLWTGAGSLAIRGQVLVIPIGDTIIYVEPLYLQSSDLTFPELKKVIIADGDSVVMADSVDEGLAKLIGDVPPEVGNTIFESGVKGAPPGVTLEQLDQVEEAFSNISKSLDELEDVMDSLRSTIGGQ